VSKSLAKEGDQAYGNITKVKAIKNKMSPPYMLSNFEIVYGVGIDRIGEVLQLINDYGIGKKWGKTMTIGETKYDLDKFKDMLTDNEDFYNDIREQIIAKINKIEKPKIEEDESTIED
jgi:recombination protein RecA